MLPLDLTIAIPVRNEEKNLPGCLQAIKGLAQSVVVIDSASTDKTREIADEFGAKVVDFEWDGRFPKKRNWFLRNHTPDTKWILFLDADEYLTDEFKQELRDVLNKEDNKVGYWLSYTIYFLGRNLKGGYPLDKLALFRVGAGEYERIDEEQWSKLDMEVHEHPILKGEIGRIKSKIDHLDFRGVGHYVNKHVEYANWEAARFLKKLSDPEFGDKLTWKQKIKYSLMQSVFIGPVYFIGSFFFLGGFRDGARGFAFAILKMAYFTQVYCRLMELKKESAARKLPN